MASMLEYLQEMERRKALGMTPGVPYASKYPASSTWAPFQNLRKDMGYYKSNIGDIAASSNPATTRKAGPGRPSTTAAQRQSISDRHGTGTIGKTVRSIMPMLPTFTKVATPFGIAAEMLRSEPAVAKQSDESLAISQAWQDANPNWTVPDQVLDNYDWVDPGGPQVILPGEEDITPRVTTPNFISTAFEDQNEGPNIIPQDANTAVTGQYGLTQNYGGFSPVMSMLVDQVSDPLTQDMIQPYNQTSPIGLPLPKYTQTSNVFNFEPSQAPEDVMEVQTQVDTFDQVPGVELAGGPSLFDFYPDMPMSQDKLDLLDGMARDKGWKDYDSANRFGWKDLGDLPIGNVLPIFNQPQWFDDDEVNEEMKALVDADQEKFAREVLAKEVDDFSTIRWAEDPVSTIGGLIKDPLAPIELPALPGPKVPSVRNFKHNMPVIHPNTLAAAQQQADDEAARQKQKALAKTAFDVLMQGRDRGEPSSREINAMIEVMTEMDTFGSGGMRNSRGEVGMDETGYTDSSGYGVG